MEALLALGLGFLGLGVGIVVGLYIAKMLVERLLQDRWGDWLDGFNKGLEFAGAPKEPDGPLLVGSPTMVRSLPEGVSEDTYHDDIATADRSD